MEVEFEVGIWRLLLGKMTVVISHSYSKPGENCKIPVAVFAFVIIMRAIEVVAAVVLAHNQHCPSVRPLWEALSLNVNQFSNYEEFQCALARKYDLECELGQHLGWELVFVDTTRCHKHGWPSE